MKTLGALFIVGMVAAWSPVAAADVYSNTVVFSEAGFPAADAAEPSTAQLAALLPGARLASSRQLSEALKDPPTRLLVLPYGSAFPEAGWDDIFGFLQRGGNLLVLGGRPFTRAAYREANGWKLRDYSVRFARALMIDQYQTTPGSEGSQFTVNPDLPLPGPSFTWTRAFSPVIRLSAIDLYKRGGAAGSIDARLDALAWGVKDGRKVSAPAIAIDHLRNGFGGGRWVLVNSELTADFYSGAGASQWVPALAGLASRGSQEFNVRPVYPLYFPGEPIELEAEWHDSEASDAPLTLTVTSYRQDQPQSRAEVSAALPSQQPLFCPRRRLQGSTSLTPNCALAANCERGIIPASGCMMRSFCAPARA